MRLYSPHQPIGMLRIVLAVGIECYSKICMSCSRRKPGQQGCPLSPVAGVGQEAYALYSPKPFRGAIR